MAEKYDIYVASPFFTTEERENCIKVIKFFRASGYKVYAPMEHEIKDAWSLSNSDWGFQVFCEDICAISSSRAMVVLDYGLYSDSGTAWECGYAFAKNIPVCHVCIEPDCYKNYKYSLMMINGNNKRVFYTLEDLLNGYGQMTEEEIQSIEVK